MRRGFFVCYIETLATFKNTLYCNEKQLKKEVILEQVALTIDSVIYFDKAASFARQSLCKRARCGCVIVKNGKIMAGGYNAPPLDNLENQKCEYVFSRDRERHKNDCTCCIHAEWRAIMDALKKGVDLKGSILYFTRVDDDGNKFFSTEKYEPHCTVCSRLALDTGISSWVLWGQPEPTMYEAKEYNDISYEFHLR